MLLHLGHPIVNGLVRLLISCVVNNDDAVSSLVITGGDSLEPFLTSGVPDLQLDSFTVDAESSDFLRE